METWPRAHVRTASDYPFRSPTRVSIEELRGPLVSIITPVFNPPVDAFKRCIESVLAQTSSDWEWRIADNGSSDPDVLAALEELDARSEKVIIEYLDENRGIASGSNAALAHASGDFIALLDHDDELAADAIATFASVVASPENSEIDYAYSDEEILDGNGKRAAIFAKPGWSPSRLRSQMYCGHLSFLRRELVEAIGGFNPEFEGSQDYDLVLRVTERARRIVHIPRVLYSWRAGEGSAALDPDGKPWAYAAGIAAVQAHCDRLGIRATVEATSIVGVHRLRRKRDEQPLVTVVIPTAGSPGMAWGQHVSMIDKCMDGVLERSSYAPIEIVCVLDQEWRGEQPVENLMDRFDGRPVRFVTDRGAFNFSRKMNLGAFHARGSRLVFLNDDTDVITPDWLESMLSIIEEGDVGIVGAALLFSDGTTQHAGQYLNGVPHHMLYRYPFSEPGPMSCLRTERECAGVTAACAMTRRDVFEHVGGFCEDLPNNYNDVDFSLKVRAQGMRVVWTPWAQLWHHESTSRLHFHRNSDHSRSNAVQPHEHEFMRLRWQESMLKDPFIVDSMRVDVDKHVAFPLFR